VHLRFYRSLRSQELVDLSQSEVREVVENGVMSKDS
jgi:hypothetical protein